MNKQKLASAKQKNIVVSRQNDGPRQVISTTLGNSGARDVTYYYNIIDYNGDMADYVNITRHRTLKLAITEARRFALDRRWAGPGTNAFYAGIPPRIIRTVGFVELHRIQVKGPLPRRLCDDMLEIEKEINEKEFRELGNNNGNSSDSDMVLYCIEKEKRMDAARKRFKLARDPKNGHHPSISQLSRNGA